jgi:hypothetical protein
MKSLPYLVLLFTLIFGSVCLLVVASCASPAQQTAAQALAETVTAATKDGIVTQAEADGIADKMKAYVDAPGIKWAELGGTVLASLAATFLGLRYAPNSVIVGAQEAAALNKAAGIS